MTYNRISARDVSADWLQHMDNCFVSGRDRRHGVAERYPMVFGSDSAAVLWLFELEQRVVSGVVTFPRELTVGGRLQIVWSIGFLHTLPHHQGKGQAHALFRLVEQHARAERIGAILFWGIPTDLFHRSGYRGLGGHQLGHYTPQAGEPLTKDVPPVVAEDFERMRRIADRNGFARHRSSQGWASLPMAADRLVILANDDAYIFAGLSKDGRTGYLYEIVGAERDFPELWARLENIAANWVINAHDQDAGSDWILANTATKWRANDVAHALFIADGDAASASPGLTLPIFDWI
jgi:GNAT superfamily N-acetyltransferase